ncbi:hypothetical protein TNCV_864531 [Trichonephila clavipes]|nr:hypothetical protein TNCV_864531 [Trichonephila clavipes]
MPAMVGYLNHWATAALFLSGRLWFQQDGATYVTARATIDLLKDTFGDRLISRFGHVVNTHKDLVIQHR